MALYMMFGKYSGTAIGNITANRTKEAVGLVERADGQVLAMYAMLGMYDVVLVVNLPGNREAMEVSVGLSRITGVQFTTGPVIPIERFDEMIETKLLRASQKPDLPDDIDLPDENDNLKA